MVSVEATLYRMIWPNLQALAVVICKDSWRGLEIEDDIKPATHQFVTERPVSVKADTQIRGF